MVYMEDIISELFKFVAATFKWFKKFVCVVVEDNFTDLENAIFFIALFLGFVLLLLSFTGSAYFNGYDSGESDGLIRGFASGTTWSDAEKR